jgi:cell division protease FtsH
VTNGAASDIQQVTRIARAMVTQFGMSEKLAQGLLEYETLTGDEIRKVLAGEPLDRSDDSGTPPTAPADDKPRLSAVPKVGKPKRGDEGGLAPAE